MGQIWTALIGLAFVPLYIKYLGVEAYGLIGLFTVLQTGLALLDLGMTPALSKEMAYFTGGSRSINSTKNLFKTIELITIILSIILFLLIYACSEWIASSWIQSNRFNEGEIAYLFNLMGFVAAIRFLESIYRSAIIGLQRQVLFNIENIILSTLRALGAVLVLVYISATLEVFFIWQAFVSILAIIVFKITTIKILPSPSIKGKFKLMELKSVWKFASGILGINIITFLITQSDKLFLSKLIDLKEFGFYTLATTISTSLFLLCAPITQAWFPKLSELNASNNLRKLKLQFHRASQLVIIFAGSAALVIIFFPELLLYLWTQNLKLSIETSSILIILMIGSLLNCIIIIPYNLQLVYGWTKLSLISNIVLLLIITPFYFIVIPRYGVLGAAWIWVFINACNLFIVFYFMFKRILNSEKWNWFFLDVISPLIVLIILLSIIKFIIPIPNDNFFKIMYLIGVSLTAIFGSILGSNIVRSDLRSLFKSYLKNS